MLELGAPEIFFAHYVAQLLLASIDRAAFSSSSDGELQKQLRNVLDTIAYAVLLFSVVKSCQQQFDPTTVNRLTLLHFLVFMSDFVSTWFKNYSIYLAGERTSQVTSQMTNSLTATWDSHWGRIFVGLISESFFLYEFIDLNLDAFLEITWFVPLKEVTSEGDTQLTDLKDLYDLMQFHGWNEFLTDYLQTILALFMGYRILVALI